MTSDFAGVFRNRFHQRLDTGTWSEVHISIPAQGHQRDVLVELSIVPFGQEFVVYRVLISADCRYFSVRLWIIESATKLSSKYTKSIQPEIHSLRLSSDLYARYSNRFSRSCQFSPAG